MGGLIASRKTKTRLTGKYWPRIHLPMHDNVGVVSLQWGKMSTTSTRLRWIRSAWCLADCPAWQRCLFAIKLGQMININLRGLRLALAQIMETQDTGVFFLLPTGSRLHWSEKYTPLYLFWLTDSSKQTFPVTFRELRTVSAPSASK